MAPNNRIQLVNNVCRPRNNSAADVLTRIEERLARVEDSLRTAASETASTPGSRRRTSNDTTPPTFRTRLADESRRYFQHVVAQPHYDFSFRQTAGEAVTARPSIVSFYCPYYIQFENWDDTAIFYDDELAAEEQLFEIMEVGCGQGLDMTPRTVWQLQQNFVLNFLQWLPLLEVQAFSEHVESAQSGGFSRQSASDCLVFFALAVSVLDRNRHKFTNSVSQSELHPGLHYFHEGRQILTMVSRRTRRNVTILQCEFLATPSDSYHT
jgi:hypothetical protein